MLAVWLLRGPCRPAASSRPRAALGFYSTGILGPPASLYSCLLSGNRPSLVVLAVFHRPRFLGRPHVCRPILAHLTVTAHQNCPSFRPACRHGQTWGLWHCPARFLRPLSQRKCRWNERRAALANASCRRRVRSRALQQPCSEVTDRRNAFGCPLPPSSWQLLMTGRHSSP